LAVLLLGEPVVFEDVHGTHDDEPAALFVLCGRGTRKTQGEHRESTGKRE